MVTTIISNEYTDFCTKFRLDFFDFYLVLVTCIPCACLSSKWGYLKVKLGFVLISERQIRGDSTGWRAACYYTVEARGTLFETQGIHFSSQSK